MSAVAGARRERFSLMLVSALGIGGLGACSYEFGGAPSAGGDGGASGAGIFTSSVGSSTSSVSASTTASPASVTVATTDAASTTDASTATTGMPAMCGNGVLEGGETCETNGQGTPDAFCFSCSACAGGTYDANVGRCYIYGATNDTFTNAGAACSASWIPGATLAQPKDDVQRAAMNDLVPGGPKLVYIGLRRVDDTFRWVDDSTMDGTGAPWAAGQPSDEFDCVVVQEFFGAHHWLTAGCDNIFDLVGGYLCEWKPPPS